MRVCEFFFLKSYNPNATVFEVLRVIFLRFLKFVGRSKKIIPDFGLRDFLKIINFSSKYSEKGYKHAHVFMRLEKANCGLGATHWHLLKHEDHEDNRGVLVLRIDDASVEFIEGHNGFLRYQLDTVKANLCNVQAGRTNES
jgi:hypothetical protein